MGKRRLGVQSKCPAPGRGVCVQTTQSDQGLPGYMMGQVFWVSHPCPHIYVLSTCHVSRASYSWESSLPPVR